MTMNRVLARTSALHVDHTTAHALLKMQGPSLGLWRAAEVAALRQQEFEHPVLDLGCGDGLVTSMVLSEVDIGVDPDAQALLQAERKGIYLRLAAVAVEDLTIESGSVGTVLSNSVLEHVANLDAVLGAVARMLRPGGRLICTMPTEAFSRWLALPLAAYARSRNRHFSHLNLWSTKEWKARLARAGLAVEHVRPYLKAKWVWLWDVMELLQQIWIGERRLVSLVWNRLSAAHMAVLARHLAALNLSAPPPGGGRLIVARKV